MKVIFSTEAKSDLRHIAAYIARDAPVRALSFVKELRKTSMRIADTPLGFPLMPHHESSGIRRRPTGNYLIFYVVRDDAIYIVHILNAAVDYEAVLFPRAD